MNKKLKNALKEGFAAPKPKKKQEFLNSMMLPSVSYAEFLYLQMGYIRKRVWLFSAVLFSAALFGAVWLEKELLWCISAFMPLLALMVLTESGRSQAYGMTEFELSTRFSLKNVVLARLGILGIADFILVCLLVLLVCQSSKTTLLQTSVYLLCPYLLTAFLGLGAVRRVRGKEVLYWCSGIAFGVSFGAVLLSSTFPLLYENSSFIWWIAAFVGLTAAVAKQGFQMIKQMEEPAWSL